ncbi:DNA adenine methylase [Glutamicibacter sp. NPDC090743]|uniref:DNA adenine methylase n=1 Tax=Glutamicibacter sp. NPDC090743 TaxID=3364001 RepID=UPI00380AEE3B
MTIITKREMGASPLRYPGGKSALTGFIQQTIDALCLDDATYVEPYAGGAGAALALLERNAVAKIVINDLDPAIFAFWDSAINRTQEFLEIFDSTDLTIEEWDRQKAIYKSADISESTRLGFATFFLNRTNRSGVLNAGVIGGRSQEAKDKIGARFNREKLRAKIEWLGQERGRISVTNTDGLECIGQYLSDPDAFIYADPPYFEKGSYLYLNAFGEEDHEDLANLLCANPKGMWMLSYDMVPQITELYKDLPQRALSLNYSAHRTGTMDELLVVSKAVAPMVAEFGFVIP